MGITNILKGAAGGFLAGGPVGALVGGAAGALGGGGDVKANADAADNAMDGLSTKAIWDNVVSTAKQVEIKEVNLKAREVQAAIQG